MYNWNTDATRLERDVVKRDVLALEQKINFGLNNTKLSLEKLRKYWHQIDIDPVKRKFLAKIVWIQS